MLCYDTFACPICPILVAVDEAGSIVRVEFLTDTSMEDLLARLGSSSLVRDAQRTAPARAQLQEYFAGKRRAFNLPLSVSGTDFQRRVWRELRDIPYGETRTYGQVAASIGQPKASRAAGHACGANRIPVIIPCHRVIGASGALTGFAGGLAVKRFLLRLEGVEVG